MTGYGTIVVDPPWRYTRNPTPLQKGGRGASAEHVYPTMTTEEIATIGVGELAAADAHLYVWVTNPILMRQREQIAGKLGPVDLVRGWGFEPKALLTWVKQGGEPQEPGEGTRRGMGWFFRGDTEHVIFAVRGNASIPAAVRQSNVFFAPAGAHSTKPDLFMDRVEAVSPAPRVELFARRARFGWDFAGDGSLGTVDVPGLRAPGEAA